MLVAFPIVFVVDVGLLAEVVKDAKVVVFLAVAAAGHFAEAFDCNGVGRTN